MQCRSQRHGTFDGSLLIIIHTLCGTRVNRVGSEGKDLHPPLSAVMHAAGVLRDAALPNQTAAALRAVAAAKAWQPDPLQPLQASVLFSSIAAFMGSPGQANYAAANSSLDALSQRMQMAGLTSSSVQWGAWATAGMAGEATRARVKRLGMDMVQPEQGLAVLRSLLNARTWATPPLVLANAFDWQRFADAAVGNNTALQRLYGELAPVGGLSKAPAGTSAASSFTLQALQRIVAEVVGLQVDPDQPLMDAGCVWRWLCE